LREAGLSLIPVRGTRWNVEQGAFSRRNQVPDFQLDRLHKALTELKHDPTLAEFLNRYFAGPEYNQLRRSIERMVEGYDAADPQKASTLALREEWMNRGSGEQARIVGGYGALIDLLVAECRSQGAIINLGTTISAIEETDGGVMACSANGNTHFCGAVILTMPLPLLQEIALPTAAREKAAASSHIGFGNVIKMMLRFETRWWCDDKRADLDDLTFLLSDATIPVWWTQFPAEYPVLTGWCGGPRTEAMAHLAADELVEQGLASLAGIFEISANELTQKLVAARALSWATILLPAEPIRMPRPKRARRNRCLQVLTAAFCFRVKRSIAGGTWERSRRRWPAVATQRGPFWPPIRSQRHSVRPHAAEMTTRISENLFGVGRAIWTGVPDRIQHIIQRRNCFF